MEKFNCFHDPLHITVAITYFISQIVLKVLKSNLNEDDASEAFYSHFSINRKHLDDVRRAVNRNISLKCLSHPAAKVPFKCHVEKPQLSDDTCLFYLFSCLYTGLFTKIALS